MGCQEGFLRLNHPRNNAPQMKTMIYCAPRSLINVNYILMACAWQMAVGTAGSPSRRLVRSPLRHVEEESGPFLRSEVTFSRCRNRNVVSVCGLCIVVIFLQEEEEKERKVQSPNTKLKRQFVFRWFMSRQVVVGELVPVHRRSVAVPLSGAGRPCCPPPRPAAFVGCNRVGGDARATAGDSNAA